MTDGTGATPAGSGRNALLEQATAAAAAGDPAAMLEALHNAGVLDGIARYIAARWSDFDFEDATLFVAAAVDRLYAKIRAGEHVRNVSAFLFKVALNKATDAYEEKKHHVSVEDAGELPDRARPGCPAAPLPRAQLVAKALELARSFLPELGQENIQRVMAFDLEAVQKGVEDLPAMEVADALALTESTVRQCRSRGWRRLRRVAKAHNIDLDTILAEMKNDEEENDNE